MKDINLIQIFINWAIPVFCGFLCTTIFCKIKNEFEESKQYNNAMKKAMVAMLRSQIVSKIEIYTKKGYLPDSARYCLEDLSNQYTALGGNHGIQQLVEQCFNLPPCELEKKGSE